MLHSAALRVRNNESYFNDVQLQRELSGVITVASKQYYSNPTIPASDGYRHLGSEFQCYEDSCNLIQALDLDGFCHIKDFLNGKALKRYIDAIDVLFTQEGSRAGSDHAYQEDAVKRLGSLPFKDPVFAEFLKDPLILSAGQNILGKGVGMKLIAMNARYPTFDVNGQEFHSDSNLLQRAKAELKHPSGFTVIIYLNDTDKQNAPTIFLPGSHRCPDAPSTEKEEVSRAELANHQRALTPKSGDLVILNSDVWHRGGPVNSLSQTDYGRILIHFIADDQPLYPGHGLSGELPEHFRGDPILSSLTVLKPQS